MAARPLDNVTIVEIDNWMAAPSAGGILADLGAEVGGALRSCLPWIIPTLVAIAMAVRVPVPVGLHRYPDDAFAYVDVRLLRYRCCLNRTCQWFVRKTLSWTRARLDGSARTTLILAAQHLSPARIASMVLL